LRFTSAKSPAGRSLFEEGWGAFASVDRVALANRHGLEPPR
jgi:hypothetical protein